MKGKTKSTNALRAWDARDRRDKADLLLLAQINLQVHRCRHCEHLTLEGHVCSWCEGDNAYTKEEWKKMQKAAR